jgi:hypothetical protein
MHMESLILLAALGLVAPAPAQGESGPRFRFARSDIGKLPAGWQAARTGKGAGSVWKVVADTTAPSGKGLVLAQTAASPNAVFNLCVADKGSYRDVEVSVAFKAMKGELDRGGGVVWRYQDANNYYIVRMNPLEDNYRLYKVVAGKRTQLAGKEGLTVPSGEWHRIKVRQEGAKITCWLDGKKLLEATDETFTKTGRVGLWSKADAQTYFDQFQVVDLGKKQDS